MTVESRIDNSVDQFPLGMRVLAVDDDPTCLFLLETLLRRCQYHVTTTSQAITALRLLRENKNKFDLVISDVHMPDMDGFKLLELVGLEMDLPVIMLSGNGDKKLVMKGITHGACDYLLKPVRIEELKNIWQHVIRRKKNDKKDQSSSCDQDRLPSCRGEGAAGIENADQKGKFNKKRKDQNEEDDEEQDENGQDSEDPSTQKKPRVVWSVDLHRKFVTAVNQLGIDKAMPKKILDSMNVENLTRENVASHLQKYRLYLKRISCVANQQANMVTALGSTDTSYLRLGSPNGLGNLHPFSGTGQFHNIAFKSFLPHGRLNSPWMGIRGLSSSGMIQLSSTQNSSNCNSDQLKLQPPILPGNHCGSMLQRIPIPTELDKRAIHVQDPSPAFDDIVFPISSGLPYATATVNGSNNSILCVTNGPMMSTRHRQEDHSGGKFGNQSSSWTSLNSEICPPSLDHGRCNDSFLNTVQSTSIQSNSVPSSDSLKLVSPFPSRENSAVLEISTNHCNISSVTSISTQSQESRTDLQWQSAMTRNHPDQINNNIQLRGWDQHNQDSPYQLNRGCSLMESMQFVGSAAQTLDQKFNNNHTLRDVDSDSIEQSNLVDTIPMKQKLSIETLNLNHGYVVDQQYMQGTFVSNSFGSLEDLTHATTKRLQVPCPLGGGEKLQSNN